MAVENLIATSRTSNELTATSRQAPNHGGVNCVVSRVKVSAAASATSTYLMARLPGSARILPSSALTFDALASVGSPTLDVGTFGYTSADDDDDSLNDGIDATTASNWTPLLKDENDSGRQLGQIATGTGQAGDVEGWMDVTITIKDADCNTGGSLTLTIMYLAG